MNEENTAPNNLITFQVNDGSNETQRDAAWQERKTLSELIRELCVGGFKNRPSATPQERK